MDLVPSTADSVLIIKTSELLQDKDFATLYENSRASNLQQNIGKFEAESGINASQINKVIIFLTLDQAEVTDLRDAKIGLILRGTLDKNKIIESMRNVTTISETQYEGYTIYSDLQSDSKADIAFIEDGMMVVGTKGATKEVIDVKKGKLASIKSNSNITKVFENIDMGSIFIFATQIPESSKKEIPNNVGPISVKSFSSIRSLGFSISKAAEKIEIKFASFSDDAASASKVADTIDGSIKLAKGMVESGSKIEALLKKITVSSKGEIVTIQLSTISSELKDVGDELNKLTGASITPTQCSFPAGFTCVSWKLYTNGILYLKIGQGTGKTINITGIRCTTNTNLIQQGKPVSYPSSNTVLIRSGSMAEFYVTCTDEADNTLIGAADDTYNGKLYINYTEVETGISRIVVGAISAKYELSQGVMNKQLCEAGYGHWNECGSPCTGEPDGEVCAQVCVPMCECGGFAGAGIGAYICPTGYYCMYKGKMLDISTTNLGDDTGRCVTIE
jgi:hypothetical protein